MADFEWHTEDNDDAWEGAPRGEGGSPRERRWRVWLLIGILTVGLTALVARQLRATVASATDAIEQELRVTHDLLTQASAGGDIMLFNTLVSGRERVWTSTQQQMVGSGGILARDGLGLAAAGAPSVAAITLTPDLSAAVITSSVPYALPIGNGLTRTVLLNVPLHFRRGNPTWLYAPPDDSVWGAQQTRVTGRLTISFPQRDAAIVGRLAADLEAATQATCRELVCRTLQIAFVSDPQTLLLLNAPPAQVATAPLRLPAPSLVGLPTDNDAYRALLAGYAGRVLPALVAEAVGYRCCARVAFFEALVGRQLVAQGLAAPLGPADYEAALAVLQTPGLAPDAWWLDDPRQLTAGDRALAAALVEYLLTQRTSQPLTVIYSHLLMWRDYDQFLQQVVIEDRATWERDRALWLAALMEDFARYISARATPQAQRAGIIAV